MTDLLKAMNPTAKLDTEALALGAAKISAVGMVLGAVRDAIGGWYASTPEGVAAAGALVERLTGQAPDAAAMASQAQMGLMMGAGVVVLQLILAAVQWFKPNIVLPILFLVLVIWALGSSLLALAVPAFGGVQPMWLTLVSAVLMLIAAITHIASIRGASALSKIRYDAANTYDN